VESETPAKGLAGPLAPRGAGSLLPAGAEHAEPA